MNSTSAVAVSIHAVSPLLNSSCALANVGNSSAAAVKQIFFSIWWPLL